MTSLPAKLHPRPDAGTAARRPSRPSLAARRREHAFARACEDLTPALYRYCRSILRHDQDAQDAVQSTLTKAFAALQRDQRDIELRPWLFRIAHNEAISLLRRRPPTVAMEDVHATSAAPLEDLASDRGRLATLQADLATLPDRQRAALVLRELNGLSHEEIAGVLATSPRAIKQTIFEARRALLECEEGRGMGCESVQRALSDGDGRVRRGRRLRAHLRACPACRAFETGLTQRPGELAALAPALPPAAVAALVAHALPAGSVAASSAGAGGGLAFGGGLAGTAKVVAVAAATASLAGGGVVAGHAVLRDHARRHPARVVPAAPASVAPHAARDHPSSRPVPVAAPRHAPRAAGAHAAKAVVRHTARARAQAQHRVAAAAVVHGAAHAAMPHAGAQARHPTRPVPGPAHAHAHAARPAHPATPGASRRPAQRPVSAPAGVTHRTSAATPAPRPAGPADRPAAARPVQPARPAPAPSAGTPSSATAPTPTIPPAPPTAHAHTTSSTSP